MVETVVEQEAERKTIQNLTLYKMREVLEGIIRDSIVDGKYCGDNKTLVLCNRLDIYLGKGIDLNDYNHLFC